MAEIAVEATDVPAQLPNVRVAVLGAGKMGGILLQAFLKQNLFAPDQIHATVGHAERALALSTQWGVDVSTNNLEAASQADLILLGVKPFQVPDLIAEIRPALTKTKTLVSFAASVKTRAIEEAAGLEIAVIRAMPNTPVGAGRGRRRLSAADASSAPRRWRLAQRIFETVGRTVVVDEKHMDAVTGLSASGPGLHLHHHRGAGRGRRQGRPAARYRHATGRANHLRRRQDGARNRLPSRAAQGRRNHSRRLHHRRHSRTRRRRPARHSHQSRHARHANGPSNWPRDKSDFQA